jgi:hypothetical protein
MMIVFFFFCFRCIVGRVVDGKVGEGEAEGRQE